MSSPRPDIVAADANVLLAALARKAAARILTAPELVVVTTARNIGEIDAHVPEFAERYHLSVDALRVAVAALSVEPMSKPTTRRISLKRNGCLTSKTRATSTSSRSL